MRGEGKRGKRGENEKGRRGREEGRKRGNLRKEIKYLPSRW